MFDANILFVDLESPRGHKDVDYFFVKNVFPHFQKKYFLLEKGLFEEISKENDLPVQEWIHFFPCPGKESKGRNRASIWLDYVRKLNFVLRFMEGAQIDVVFFISYNTMALSWLYRRFLRYRVLLLNHDNIARFIKNRMRRFIFRRLKRFNHLIYSSTLNASVKDYLKEKTGFEKIFFIDHQVNEWGELRSRRYSRESIYLFAPSASNDSGKILRLLESAKSHRIRIGAKVGRPLYEKYSDAFREKIFTGFLINEEHKRRMEEADFILLLYAGDYRFRTSGLMFDAVSFEKPVITDNEFLYRAWIEKNGIGMYVREPEEIEGAVGAIDPKRYNEYVENIRKFKGCLEPEAIGRNIAGQIETICAR